LQSCRNKNIDVLVEALCTTPWLSHLTDLNLEFVSSVQDVHVEEIVSRFGARLSRLNLNGCQKVSDAGLAAVAKLCGQRLSHLGIYWNLKLTEKGIEALAGSCPNLVHLNLSGCKGLNDRSLALIGKGCKRLELLDITRCVKLSDDGLVHITGSCLDLQVLNLYAISTFTDRSLGSIGRLKHLRVLDMCGMHLLTDEGLRMIAEGGENREGEGEARGSRTFSDLRSLNLTWCVKITDAGVASVAERCRRLELLSLHGILGVTDATIANLARGPARDRLHTLDVNGCGHIHRKDKDFLKGTFPALTCFQVHK